MSCSSNLVCACRRAPCGSICPNASTVLRTTACIPTLGDVCPQPRQSHRRLRLLHGGHGDLSCPLCLCADGVCHASDSALQCDDASHDPVDHTAAPRSDAGGAGFDLIHLAPPPNMVVLRHLVGAIAALIRQHAPHRDRKPCPAILSPCLHRRVRNWHWPCLIARYARRWHDPIDYRCHMARSAGTLWRRQGARQVIRLPSSKRAIVMGADGRGEVVALPGTSDAGPRA
jgi:hypothetical protein